MEIYANYTFCINPPEPKGWPSSGDRIPNALISLGGFYRAGRELFGAQA